MIRLAGVNKSYHVGGAALHVLRDIDLHIREGEFVAITGPSGSGKSSLLYLLGLLDLPTSGEVLIDGANASSLDEAARARVRLSLLGFVFQFHFLLPEFSALDNVMLPALLDGVARRDAEPRAR
jgi:ABC-type lipoprotein export system ATPase subunit